MAVRAKMLLLHVKGLFVKEDHRAAVRAFVFDQAVAVLIVVVILVLVVVLFVFVILREERLFEVADVAVDLLNILLQLIELFAGFPALLREGLQRIDDSQHQLALIAVTADAHALGQSLEVGNLFSHSAHVQTAFPKA